MRLPSESWRENFFITLMRAEIRVGEVQDDRFTIVFPGRRLWRMCANRVKPFGAKAPSVHEGGEVLIVGHRVVNRLLIGMIMEYPRERF